MAITASPFFLETEKEVKTLYSKVTTIEVINFMRFNHEVASFDKRNILNIKGTNGMGKSAFLKAVGVCLMNVYPQSQVNFIQYGKDYYRIVVSFDDGVSILRDKYINGQSLYEMYKDGELVFSTKVGNKLTRVSDVPDIIKNYLGLIEIGNLGTGYLNFQTRKEPLWLAETSGSENYTSLNEVLKSGEISRASALINSDKNELNSSITELEQDKQAVEMNLLTAKQYTPELLNELRNRDNIARKLMDKVSDLNELEELAKEIESLVLTPEVENIATEKYSEILSISSLLLEIGTIPDLPELSKLDIEKMHTIEDLGKVSREIDSLIVSPIVPLVEDSKAQVLSELLGICQDIQRLPDIVDYDITLMDSERLKDLQGIIQSAIDAKEARKKDSDVKEKLITTSSELSSVVKEASKHGMKFIKCNNCGSYMRVKVGGEG